ncbi:hypothetical protein [Micromonospora globbae]|uniref:hypothetical protein n=1 Tax=Micromonospora globbae TaxID=1894969 RepID=UPI0037A222D2
MGVTDMVVLVVATAAATVLGWYFFAPRRAHRAELSDGVQRTHVSVRGAYQPDVVEVRQGLPVEIVFDRCLARAEERDVAIEFGDAWLTYVRRVPAFLPLRRREPAAERQDEPLQHSERRS